MYAANLTIDNILSRTPIDLQREMSARELIEVAFVQLQTDSNVDPFTITIAYYGYDHYQGVTTYLGYFIVSISDKSSKFVTDSSRYWELFVNGLPSQAGMDSVLIQPNDEIELKWISTTTSSAQASNRLKRVQARFKGSSSGEDTAGDLLQT